MKIIDAHMIVGPAGYDPARIIRSMKVSKEHMANILYKNALKILE